MSDSKESNTYNFVLQRLSNIDSNKENDNISEESRYKKYAQELQAELNSKQKYYEEQFLTFDKQKKELGIEARGREDFYKLRKIWSKTIIKWISVLIGFNIVLTCFIGWHVFDFEKYQWFIVSVTAETFLQIVGLGYVAVHFLFSNIDKK